MRFSGSHGVANEAVLSGIPGIYISCHGIATPCAENKLCY